MKYEIFKHEFKLVLLEVTFFIILTLTQKIFFILTLTHFFPRSLDFYDIKQCFKRTFLAEIQIFSKKVHDITLYKRSQNEYRWMVLMAESWEHNEIFYQNIMIFWQNISLCYQLSAISTIQLDSIWLLWKSHKCELFLKWFVCPPQMSSWSTVSGI